MCLKNSRRPVGTRKEPLCSGQQPPADCAGWTERQYAALLGTSLARQGVPLELDLFTNKSSLTQGIQCLQTKAVETCHLQQASKPQQPFANWYHSSRYLLPFTLKSKKQLKSQQSSTALASLARTPKISKLREMKKTGFVQSEEDEWPGLRAACNHAVGGYREDRARLFLEVHSRRTRGNGQLQNEKPQLEGRFSLQGWSNAGCESRLVVSTFLLGDAQSSTGQGPGQLYLVGPTLSTALDQSLQRALHSPTLLHKAARSIFHHWKWRVRSQNKTNRSHS